MTGLFRRTRRHAAPLHESPPVAWRWLRDKLRAASDRRPARQPARGSVRVQTRLLAGKGPDEAGPAPDTPAGPAGTAPVPPITGAVPRTGWALEPPLYGERGEHPYPVREPDRDWELLLAALEPADDGTEAS